MTQNPLFTQSRPSRKATLARRGFYAALIVVALSLVAALAGPVGGISLPGLNMAGAPQEAIGEPKNGENASGLLIGDNDGVNATVKAGVFAFDGYHMKDDNGQLYGYGIEVLEMISKHSHLNFDLVGYDNSWNDMLDMLERGEIDVVTSASKTAEREALFDYSLPIGVKNTVLSVSVDNESIVSGDYSTYNGMKVGEIPGNSQNDIFAEFANEEGFGYTVVEFENADAMSAALQSGQVDAIVTSDLRKTQNEKTLDVIDDDNYYAIVRKGDTALLNEINYAIEQMNQSEGDWKNTLHYKYYGPSYSNELEFTAREQAYIDAVRSGQKKISVTALADRRPYSFEQNGQLTGILIDYFSAVADVAGLPFEVVLPTSLEDYHSIIDQERVNVVLDGITGNYANAQYFDKDFSSDVFMDASVVQVTRTDFSGDIKSIAVSDSSTGSLDKFLAEQGENTELIHYPTREEALQAVLDGNADCAYVYVYTAQEFMNRDVSNGLTYKSVYDMDVQFDIRISANTDHELVSILNKCIKRVPEATLSGLVAQYTSYSVNDVSIAEYLLANPVFIVAIALGLLLIAIVIIALVWRGHWNQRMLSAEAEANHALKEQLAIVDALSHDYSNVFAVDPKSETAKIVKLEGYVTEGLQRGSHEAYPYMPILTNYLESRVHPEDKDQLLEELSMENVLAHVSPENEYVGTYRILDDDGEVHTYQYTYVMVTDEEGSHILVGFRNIDEVVRKDQEQKEVLAEALAQAQYANNAKTTFLNSMSHDIRTPMNAIIGFTTLAGAHIENTEQVQSYLGKIMTSSNHLLSLINDVLDMSRIESGKVKIDNKETSLPEVMRDLRTIVLSDIKAKGLEFYIDMLGVSDEVVICDKLRLNQVLLNVLSNAIKYTQPGGTVSVRVVETESSPEKGTATYQFAVKDTGIGMSKKFLEHVFEPFEREETATVSGIQGTGLGLAITKNIVDMMNGTITVTSEEGKGSEFVVTFTFEVAKDVEPFVPPEELKDLRALVVDDDIDTCTSVSGMLHTIGMRPDWTTLPTEAIAHTEFAQEQNDPYSAYIIDWVMPSMSGLDLVRRIRRIIGDETPIIIATAYDWTDIEEDAKEAGVTAICSKPLFLSELRDVLLRPLVEGMPGEGDDIMVAQESAAASIKDTFQNAKDKLKGTKVLMAEDNMMSREIAKTVLEDAEIIVDAVEDGSIAVERMKEQPAGTYDVVLTDIQMPIMDGFATTRAIRELDDPEKANIPIIAVSANAFEEDREKAEAAGMSGYIPKPIEIDKLFEALEKLTNRGE